MCILGSRYWHYKCVIMYVLFQGFSWMCYRVLMCCPSAEEIFLILSLSMHLGLIRGVCGWEAAAFISGLLSVYVCVCLCLWRKRLSYQWCAGFPLLPDKTSEEPWPDPVGKRSRKWGWDHRKWLCMARRAELENKAFGSFQIRRCRGMGWGLSTTGVQAMFQLAVARVHVSVHVRERVWMCGCAFDAFDL